MKKMIQILNLLLIVMVSFMLFKAHVNLEVPKSFSKIISYGVDLIGGVVLLLNCYYFKEQKSLVFLNAGLLLLIAVAFIWQSCLGKGARYLFAAWDILTVIAATYMVTILKADRTQ